jgi:hypothetical protein
MNAAGFRAAKARAASTRARALSAKVGALTALTTVGITAFVAPAFADAPPDGGAGVAPPGVAANVTTIFQWAAWIVFAIAVAGVMFVAVKMILQHHRGEGGQAMASLFYVLGGAILTAAASGIIGALT